jgi:AraC-like DNA-binding protein
MGYALHRVEGIGGPHLVIHEQVVLIPRSGVQRVDNRVRKLIFILQGECRHRVPGLSGPHADVRLRAGDILVLPHAHPHEYVSLVPEQSYRLHAVRLAFDPEQVPPLRLGEPPPAGPEADPETDFAAFVRERLREMRHLPGGQDARIRELLSHVREEAQSEPPGFRFRVGAICTSLVTLVARQLVEQARLAQPETRDRHGHYVTLAKDYLLRHLTQSLHLEEVAAHLQISEEHLARLFKRSTGETVFDYVRRMRLEQARTLLIGSDMNVSEIAERTGFGSLAAFSRSFKRELGASPTEYRSRARRELG